MNKEHEFTIDACAERHNAKLPRFWSPADNGLSQKWEGERIWCNPPYNDIMPWLARGHTAVMREKGTECTFLLPARTDSSWWHTYAMRCGVIDFFRGRIQFEIPEKVRELLREQAARLVEIDEKRAKKLLAKADGASSNAEGSCLLHMAWRNGDADLSWGARDPVSGKKIELEPIQSALPLVTAIDSTEATTQPICRYCDKPNTHVWSSVFNGPAHEECRDEALAMLEGMAPAERRKTELLLRGEAPAA